MPTPNKRFVASRGVFSADNEWVTSLFPHVQAFENPTRTPNCITLGVASVGIHAVRENSGKLKIYRCFL